MTTPIGALRHALRLQEAHKVPDGGGGWHTVWQDMTMHPLVYAAIEELGSGETLRQRRRDSDISHRLRIRTRGDVVAGMRLVHAAASCVYDIVSVRRIGPEENWMELTALRRAL